MKMLYRFCVDKNFCVMCMVRNINENPDRNPLHINEYFCKVAALNRKIVLDWKTKMKREQKAAAVRAPCDTKAGA
jgi:hypothetical protein